MIQDAIAQLVEGEEEFTGDQMREAAEEILSGDATPCQVAAFITALRIRGEQVEQITALAQVMRNKAQRLKTPEGVVLDTCGTGGDTYGTFNVSTTAAIIAAAAGVKVAKHGNRAVSSTSGSADVLTQLGVKVDTPLELAQRCLDEIGLCFLFAPAYHSAMKHAAQARKEVGIRSIFNMVGPLSNPAGATHQLIGVYDANLTEVFARVLRDLGVERALVVHGSDGMDEITTTAATQVSELNAGDIDTYVIEPHDMGLEPSNVEDLVVDSVEQSAELMREILSGRKGPCADIAIANAGAALFAAGTVASIREGVAKAIETVASDKANEKLDALIELTNAG